MNKFSLLFLQNITPLHIGCGQDVGIVDLPIIRERITGYPYIPGSGFRGCLRNYFKNTGDEEQVKALFGPDPGAEEGSANEYAGCLAIHDAHILLFPVRCSDHVFVWITCPHVLHQFNRIINTFTPEPEYLAQIPLIPLKETEFFAPLNFSPEMLYLEEYKFTAASLKINESEDETEQEKKTEWFNNQKSGFKSWLGKIEEKQGLDISQKTVLVSDRAFYQFVNYATIIMEHNTLTTTKTVKQGALFSVESVPPETLFYSIIGTTKARYEQRQDMDAETAMASFYDTLFMDSESIKALQIGGDEGTGLGVTRLTRIL
ncbi:type III-B CRISPR module RAMP protein Cmr4 [candidate division KSB1 bacterium]|nr:type III-B CRISPR module RAMP protein Cmr4 [candidate division KSB1 bacterium]